MACFSKWDIGGCGCSCALQVQVNGCGSTPLPVGSGLTVNLKSGGSTIYTGTTNSSGIAAISGAAGTYDVEVVDGRATSRWNTQTFAGKSLTCGGTTSVALTSVKTGFACSAFCGDPLATTLYATDVNGTWTLTYNAAHVNGNGWHGCATKTGMSNVVTALAPGTCISTVGTADTPYLIEILQSVPYVYNRWAYYGGTGRVSSTPTCSGGSLNLNANIPVGCIGSIDDDILHVTGTAASCPPSPSITATTGSTGDIGTSPNPGAGSITITE